MFKDVITFNVMDKPVLFFAGKTSLYVLLNHIFHVANMLLMNYRTYIPNF